MISSTLYLFALEDVLLSANGAVVPDVLPWFEKRPAFVHAIGCTVVNDTRRTSRELKAMLGDVASTLNLDAIYVSLGAQNGGEFTALPHRTDIVRAGLFVFGYLAEWRKPAAGLVRQVLVDYEVQASEAMMVGYSIDDRDAARNAGVHYLSADLFFGRPPF